MTLAGQENETFSSYTTCQSYYNIHDFDMFQKHCFEHWRRREKSNKREIMSFLVLFVEPLLSLLFKT